jgi:hypothetical protein
LFEELLARIACLLSRGNLPYLIIGGQAVILNGESRMTRDIDTTLGINVDHLDELLVIVKELSLAPLLENIPPFVQKQWCYPSWIKTRESVWISSSHSSIFPLSLRPILYLTGRIITRYTCKIPSALPRKIRYRRKQDDGGWSQ